MAAGCYLNFDGQCREAIEFYSRAFGQAAPKTMTFGEAPAMPGSPTMGEETKKRILHAEMTVGGLALKLSDVMPGRPITVGNNVTLFVESSDEAAIRAWYSALKEGGQAIMPLGPQFFSSLYAYVVDRFGIGWQMSLVPNEP